jgi:hypothetical protein
VKSTLNIQMSLKDHNDIIQAIKYFNVIIQQAEFNLILRNITFQ